MSGTKMLGMHIAPEKHEIYHERAHLAGYKSTTQWICDILDGRLAFDEHKDGSPAGWFLENERHIGASTPRRRGRPPGSGKRPEPPHPSPEPATPEKANPGAARPHFDMVEFEAMWPGERPATVTHLYPTQEEYERDKRFHLRRERWLHENALDPDAEFDWNRKEEE